MRDDPVFHRATELWRSVCKERRDAFPLVLSEINGRCALAGCFGGSAHGEMAGRAAGQEIKLRSEQIVKALRDAHAENGKRLTRAHNEQSFRNWAIARFVEEETELRGRFQFDPGIIGRKQYLEQIAAAQERERPAMANAIKQYFAINPPVGRVRSWLRAGREVAIQFAAEFAKRLTKE